MAEQKKTAPDCRKCVFRSGKRAYLCNYSYLMGHTRRAQPPEQCTYFVEGEMLETPEETQAFLDGRKPAARRKRTKCDWDRAAELHAAGKNDCQIARELGCADASVRQWRKRNDLPANAERGGQQTDRTGQDRTGQAADTAGEEHKTMMKKETKNKIYTMLRSELENRRTELDRVLKQGGEGKRELNLYRETLLALDDFEEATKDDAG